MREPGSCNRSDNESRRLYFPYPVVHKFSDKQIAFLVCSQPRGIVQQCLFRRAAIATESHLPCACISADNTHGINPPDLMQFREEHIAVAINSDGRGVVNGSVHRRTAISGGFTFPIAGNRNNAHTRMIHLPDPAVFVIGDEEISRAIDCELWKRKFRIGYWFILSFKSFR